MEKLGWTKVDLYEKRIVRKSTKRSKIKGEIKRVFSEKENSRSK